MSYIIAEEVIKNQIHTCFKCGKRFVFTKGVVKDDLKMLDDHTKQCTCNHSWSDWSTSNLGTWPDYEPYTTRRCSKCNKQETL